MILHHYTTGDPHIANYYGHGLGSVFKSIFPYYGHGFGSIFSKLFSKVAAKTASRAALSAAKRVGSTLVKAGAKKVMPMAKRTITSVVKKGMKKAVPVAKKLVKKGVKRAAEEAQSAIANKVRKVEQTAIKKGVSPDLAHMVSSFVENGSRRGISSLSKLANKKGNRIIAKTVNKVNKVNKVSKSIHPKKPLSKPRGIKPHRQRIKSRKRGARKKRRQKVSYDIQNLIDTA